jgi:hypothetical protein
MQFLAAVSVDSIVYRFEIDMQITVPYLHTAQSTASSHFAELAIISLK